MLIVSILSFGMEQVVVRRIAASQTSDWAAAAFFVHALVGSVIASVIILLISSNCDSCKEGIKYLPLFFTAQCFLFLVLPLKQFLNAKHLFTPYAIIAFFTNLVKVIIAFVLVSNNLLCIQYVAYILIFTAFLELILLLVYVKLKTRFSFKFKIRAYKKLIKESAPQYLSIIFDSSLSRLDWILLGMIGSYAATGGYAFAYRAYELARLPIVIIAPVILNIFARLLVAGNKLDSEKEELVRKIYTVQIFLSIFIPLALNIIWSPFLNQVFNNKYGTSNATEFLILSVCIPLHFAINLMWTIAFSAKMYTKVARITMLVALTNLVLNLMLMPFYQGIGASVAYLLTTVVQAAMFYVLLRKNIIHLPVLKTVILILIGSVCYLMSSFVDIHYIVKMLIVLPIFAIVSFALRLITIAHFRTIYSYLRK